MGKSCRRDHLLTVTAALAFVCLLATTEQVESTTGSFEIRLHRFLNPGCCGSDDTNDRRPLPPAGQALTTVASSANRKRLSDHHQEGCPPGGGKEGHCSPVSFRICVKNYQASVDSSTPCIIGEFLTRVFNEKSLPRLLEEAPPIVFYFNFTWSGSFSFVIEAYHTLENSGERMLISRFVGQRSLIPKMEWTEDDLTVNRTVITVSYRVRCQPNYFGHSCDVLCKPRDDGFGHYTCRNDGKKICMPGWKGDYCTKAVCRPGCHKDHGYCKKPHDCNCRPGWEGELCDICSRYPGCEHGTCNEPWQCNCNEGWGGLFCNQDLNYCTNHRPCKNGGTCTNTGQGSFTCTCSNEYMGSVCDILRNPCQSNPCKNGGTCSNPSKGNYTCMCALGFYGPNCETSANICSENPCKNGGSCVHDPGGFACACPHGFSGVHCEKFTAKCTTNFCLNNAECIEKPSGPHCKCVTGFVGIRCEVTATCRNGENCSSHVVIDNPCSSSPCLNGGFCRSELTTFSCSCPKGFGGKLCEAVSRAEHRSSKSVPITEQMNNFSTAISNISHQVSEEQGDVSSPSSSRVAVILSCTLIASTVFISCAICLAIKFCRRRRQEPKHFDEAREDEIKQNERNILRMNNKCNVPQNKIVNTLDHKVNNSGPFNAKAVNAQMLCSQKKLPEKNLLYVQRTLERRDKNSGCCHAPPNTSSSGAAVFVIQDHVQQLSQKIDDCYHHQLRPPSLQMDEDVFATEV